LPWNCNLIYFQKFNKEICNYCSYTCNQLPFIRTCIFSFRSFSPVLFVCKVSCVYNSFITIKITFSLHNSKISYSRNCRRISWWSHNSILNFLTKDALYNALSGLERSVVVI
jgi:hypothetical protein